MSARRIYHFGLDGWPVFPIDKTHAYPRVWREAAEKALAKLQAGEWVAEGISAQFSPRSVPIDTNLWDYLRIKDRVDEAEGAGFHFVALTVSDVRPPKVEVTHAEQALLRGQLTHWIRSHAESSSLAILRADQLAAAREAFAGQTISDNMYRECRRAAALDFRLVQRGRPKAKGSEL